MSIDLVNTDASLYLNGESQDDRKRIQQKYDKIWKEMIPELQNGYMFELGRYMWDQTFIFGTWLDINIWDEVLTSDKLASYSNCKDIAARRGSFVNQNSVWNITGEIIKQVTDKDVV